MPALARKLGLVSLVVGILGAILPVTSASAQICHLPLYGGDYYCQYPVLTYDLVPGETQQVWVIGTDYSVWTRWNTNGRLSNWVSMGGRIRHPYHTGDFYFFTCGGKPVIVVVGLDNLQWYRLRQSDGVWTSWAHYYGLICPG